MGLSGRVLIAALLLAGCAKEVPTACATPPSPPLEMRVEVADACAFYADGTTVTLTLDPFDAMEDVRAGVSLPPGVELLYGQLSHDGPVPTEGIGYTGKVRGTNATHDVRFWTDGPGLRSFGSYAAPQQWWRFTMGDDRVARAEQVAPPAVPFRVRVAVEPANASHMVATATSDVDIEARVLLYFSWDFRDDATHPEWEGDAGLAGDPPRVAYVEWKGLLRAGEPKELRYHAPWPPSEGCWTISATILGDARVDNRIVADELNVVLESGALTTKNDC